MIPLYRNKVAELLQLKGWSQAELHRRSGLGRSTIRSLVENPLQLGSKASVAGALARAFRVPADTVVYIEWHDDKQGK